MLIVISASSVISRGTLLRTAGTEIALGMTGMVVIGTIIPDAEDTLALIVVVLAGREVMIGIVIETIEGGMTDSIDGHRAGLREDNTGVTGERDIDRILCCMMIRTFKLNIIV